VKHWQPPEGLSPEEVRAVIAAATCERDRLLLHVLWATGARISEVLVLRASDVRRDSLVLPNRKNPNQTFKRVFLPGAELGLTGELLLWAKEHSLADDEPLFFSRKRSADGSRRPLQRGQAWLIVKEASERAAVRVLALRASKHGAAGQPAPVHPHLFRHARVRQIVRQTKSLPLAQRQAGWSRLQPAYLSIGDEEARNLMREVTD
jgi:integrase